MKQDRKIDFRGQEIFVGIDVHKKSWQVGTGIFVSEVSVDGDEC